MYNNYVYGNIVYGFLNEGSVDLMTGTFFNRLSETEKRKVRATAMPNTFGVIGETYENTISFVPKCEGWINIYYMLCYKEH